MFTQFSRRDHEKGFSFSWKMVLDLIIEDNGGDRLIEAKRGKLYRAPSPEMEDLNEDRESRDVNDDERTQEDIDVMDQGLDTVAY